MINFDKVIELSSFLERARISTERNHLESRCPFCGDSKTKSNVRRFHVDWYAPYNTFIYKCHRCGTSGNLISLWAHLHNTTYDQATRHLTNKIYDPEKIKSQWRTKKIYLQKQDKNKVFDLDLASDCYSIDTDPSISSQANRAIKILKKFKEERKIPDSLPIYYAHTGRYSGRIILPIFVNGELVYFQARAVYDEVQPKYLNPKIEKNQVILNIDHFDPDKYIIVTEGIIDAHMVEDGQGTCVIGGYVDLAFIEKNLLPHTQKGVIICLDNPNIDNNAKNVLKRLFFSDNKKINKFKSKVSFFVMPKEYGQAKDLNDLVVKYDKKDVYDFITNNSFSMLKMKMYLIKG